MGLRGFSVIEAEGGREALRLLSDQIVDTVLMDIQMPDMDGYEATIALRQDRRFDEVPILALTSRTSEDVRRRCLDCGMNGLIAKPFDASTAKAVHTMVAHGWPGGVRQSEWLLG